MDEKQRILIQDSQEWAWNNIFTAAKNTKEVISTSVRERELDAYDIEGHKNADMKINRFPAVSCLKPMKLYFFVTASIKKNQDKKKY